MKLFKRILNSFFPDEIVNQPINPISMFISFISAKQFFSVVNRKIIENYKLNLFDISLDSFDAKLWFGKSSMVKHKEIENYYSYWVVSNFNGYKFYSSSNIWSLISMVCSIYTKEVFKKYDYKYFFNFLLTVYYLHFIFISRIKVFPYDNEKQNYTWFVNVFFEYYKYFCSLNWFKIINKDFEKIKISLLENIQVFFMLFHIYQKYNNVFYIENENEYDFYEWLFDQDLKWWNMKNITFDYINNYEKYSKSYKISITEKKILKLILPADVLIRYLFDENDVYKMVDFVIQPLFDKNLLDTYMSSFLKWNKDLENFVEYIFNYWLFKKKYFVWVKNFISWKYRMDTEYDMDVQEELDELISSIWQDEEVDESKIPDKLKKESQTTERLINFYMTFIGWFWVSRWDNLFARLFRNKIYDIFYISESEDKLQTSSINFYWNLLYVYSKNTSYYKLAFDNIKAGKEKFNLPNKTNLKNINSKKFILSLFHRNFVYDFFQDINHKDIKLYIQNKKIISLFKEEFYPNISNILKWWDKDLLDIIYSSSLSLFSKNISTNILLNEFKESDIKNLKENLYTFDLWIYLKFIENLNKEWFNKNNNYTDISLIWILSFLRNTIFAFCLYYTFVSKEEINLNKDLKLDELKKIYITEILLISSDDYNIFENILDKLIYDYIDFFKEWLNIDDNKMHFKLAYDNWINFLKENKNDDIFGKVMWEDIIWFRWYLKNVSYYNKKFVIPRD